ncbi:PH domain-containing protein [Noviherbaspirillum sp.]|uniref:PH domain-containing protein n=1 Tax=Noviherbaspirillum sp. TaxID=1926288 RepID=UPI002FE0083D
MFKKLASDALGLSDIGVIITPENYKDVDADDYLFHEDGEKIFFLIKSRKDEYCFTNLALIHVDGESAVSSKRSIRRYDYASYRVSNPLIETAGTVDLDVELKFTLGDKVFSVDIRKKFIEQVKDIYKALFSIGKQQTRDEIGRSNAIRTLEATASMYKINDGASAATIVTNFNAVLENLNRAVLDRHTKRDFSDVFQKYIQS